MVFNVWRYRYILKNEITGFIMAKLNKKIAIVGARGIANYGGFESIVKEISSRLSEKGYDVYCSCEKDDKLDKKYGDVNLVYFPIRIPEKYGIKRKILHILYKIYFGIYFSVFKKCDIVYFLGVSQNIFTIVPRLFGIFSIVNMGGLEWERSKFNSFEKFLLKTNFKLALIAADYMIIDNKGLANHISEKYHKKLVYVPYGVDINTKNSNWDSNVIKKYVKDDFKVLPNSYWLIVTRLSPDNNVHIVLDAFIKSNSNKPLIIVGSLSSSPSYCSKLSKILKKNKDKKITFVGGIYNQDDLNMFRSNCFGYIHAHSIGGTNPSLLEAMFLKNIIIAHDNEFNREVAGDAAIYFHNSEDLQNNMEMVEINIEDYIKLKNKGYFRVLREYSWEQALRKFEQSIQEHS